MHLFFLYISLFSLYLSIPSLYPALSLSMLPSLHPFSLPSLSLVLVLNRSLLPITSIMIAITITIALGVWVQCVNVSVSVSVAWCVIRVPIVQKRTDPSLMTNLDCMLCFAFFGPPPPSCFSSSCLLCCCCSLLWSLSLWLLWLLCIIIYIASLGRISSPIFYRKTKGGTSYSLVMRAFV